MIEVLCCSELHVTESLRPMLSSFPRCDSRRRLPLLPTFLSRADSSRPRQRIQLDSTLNYTKPSHCISLDGGLIRYISDKHRVISSPRTASLESHFVLEPGPSPPPRLLLRPSSYHIPRELHRDSGQINHFSAQCRRQLPQQPLLPRRRSRSTPNLRCQSCRRSKELNPVEMS